MAVEATSHRLIEVLHVLERFLSIIHHEYICIPSLSLSLSHLEGEEMGRNYEVNSK